MSNDNKFYLYQFLINGNDIVVTRGKSQAQAQKFLTTICNIKQVVPQNYCRIDAAWKYSISHPYDWITIPPLWLGERKIEPENHNFKFRFFNADLIHKTIIKQVIN